MLDKMYKYDNKAFFPILDGSKDIGINQKISSLFNDESSFLNNNTSFLYNQEISDFEKICKIHNEIYTKYSIYSGEKTLNYSVGIKNIDKKIYNSFFADRGYNIFIHAYDKPSSIKLVVDRLFYGLGDLLELKETKKEVIFERISELIIKLHQANIFKFGNIEVIFIMISHILKTIDTKYKRIFEAHDFNLIFIKSLLEHKNLDSYEYNIIKQQIALFLEQLLFHNDNVLNIIF